MRAHRLAAVLLPILVACAYQPMKPMPTVTLRPSGSLSITDFGATGGDTSDDTAAINAAISAAKAQGNSVYVPTGNFHHNTTITLDSVTMTGEGDASVLVATNPQNSSIELRGNGPVLKSVKTACPSATTRLLAPWNTAVEVEGATNFLVENVTVERSPNGGVIAWGGAGPGKIIGNRISDTLADAIHMTNGSHDIIVANNYIRRAGDDFIAAVGYLGDGQPYNIFVQGNDVADQNWGRGITAVGARDVTIQNNTIARTKVGAGILVAAEESWNTYGNDNILIRNNTLTDNSGPTTGQGAILLFVSPGQGVNSRVRVENNTVNNARYDGIKIDGDNRNVAILQNKINNPAGTPISRFNGTTNVYCSGNLLNGAAYNASCGGSLNFTVTGSSLTYSGATPPPAHTFDLVHSEEHQSE